MRNTVVINVVGLSSSILGPHSPNLLRFASQGSLRKIRPVFPALTCSAQATYLTGLLPRDHGVVGNGWYFHDLAQVWFWRQSHRLVQGEKIWETARKYNQRFTCANLFWWFNMYSSVNYSVTPRPVYRSDGLKLPDIYTDPPELRNTLQRKLGPFPLFEFWGPAAGIRSSRWIAQASLEVYDRMQPNLSLIYLPHLDYCLQKEGPRGPSVSTEIRAIDSLCGELIHSFKDRGVNVVILSEYGINEVSASIPINRVLRRHGWLKTRDECGEDHFDAGSSSAFAVADHQISQVYVLDQTLISSVRRVLEETDGVGAILDRKAQKELGIDHPRSGDLIAVAKRDKWFSYAYWFENHRAPDYAKTVDIHRKPGYDPTELFIDPEIRFPKLHIARRIIAKTLGFRYRMDVTPLSDRMVRGSHGTREISEEFWPLLISERTDLFGSDTDPILPTSIKELILHHLYD